MQHSSRLLVTLFAALLAIATITTTAKAQVPKTPSASAAKSETLSQAVSQVDGITSEVVDNLWAGTDNYWHHGDYYRIVSILRVCVEADPVFTDAYGNGAYLLWSLGDTQGADLFLKYGTTREPQLWDLQFEFGRHLQLNAKQHAAALPYLQRATANPKADVLAWSTLAHCYEDLGRYPEAVSAWRTVVKKFPGFASGPGNLKRVEAKTK